MNLGSNIKKIRLARGYDQAYMAGELGISVRAYSKLENNEIELSVKRLLQLADILKVDVSEFLENSAKHVYNHIVSQHKGGNGFVINQAEKAMELYDRLISEKDEHIQELKNRVAELELNLKEIKSQFSKK